MSYKKITSYEIACEVNKQDPKQLPDVSNLPKDEADDVINSLMLKRIVKALNTDQETGKVWKPDYFNHNDKYCAWPEIKASKAKPGGFGFSRSYFDCTYTHTHVGSRLSLESSEKVMHLYEHFEELLIKCLLILE